MKRSILVVTAAAGALALAPPAPAKEVTELAVCGPDACHQVAKSAFGLFGHGPGGTGASGGGAALESFYVLRFGMGENGRTLGRDDGVYFLPHAGMTRARGDGVVTEPFTALTPAQLRALRAAASGLRPFATPTVRSVRIHGFKSADPNAYGGLLGTLEPRPIPANAGLATRFAITWERANPWSGDRSFDYLARVNVLCRSDGCFAVPSPLAERIEREAAGLAPVAGGGFPWATLVTALASGSAAAIALALLLVARRRRTRRLAVAGATLALAALALAGVAAAKEVRSAAVCGPSACAKVPKEKAALFLRELHGGGEAVSSGATLEAWYRLRFGVGTDDSGKEIFMFGYYLPQAGVLKLAGDERTVEPWLRPSAEELEALRAVESSVAPYAKPRPAVTVAGRRVLAATPYVGLLGPLQARPLPARTGASTMIRLRWREKSPWSAETALTYYARVNLVCRSDGCFGVPAGMAADVERGLRGTKRH